MPASCEIRLINAPAEADHWYRGAFPSAPDGDKWKTYLPLPVSEPLTILLWPFHTKYIFVVRTASFDHIFEQEYEADRFQADAQYELDMETGELTRVSAPTAKWLLIGGAILLLILVALYIWRKG